MDGAYVRVHEDIWICAQMQSTLKRGVAHGILKKIGDSYSLPIDSEISGAEVAVQEIGLLDSYYQRKVQQGCKRYKTRKGGGVRRDRKTWKSNKKRVGQRSRACKSERKRMQM